MSKRSLSSSPVPQAAAPSPKRTKVELPVQPSSTPAPEPSTSSHVQKHKHKKRKLPPPPDFGSHDDVLQKEVSRMLAAEGVQLTRESGWEPPEGIKEGMELELTVAELSSTGDSLSRLPEPYPPWVVVTPFGLPEERLLVQIRRPGHGYFEAKLLKVLEANQSLRDMNRVKCQYFGKCAGCQYQMLSYDTQLDFKRQVVVRAYQHFSDLPDSAVPTVLPTIASPQQYAYRTKITPHFDAPPSQRARKGDRRRQAKGVAPGAEAGELTETTNGHTKGKTGLGERGDWELRIGFDEKGGGRKVMDIEECPIATDVINEGLKIARKNVQDTIQNYTRGATLLLRDSVQHGGPPAPGNHVYNQVSESKKLGPSEADAAALEEVGVDDGRAGAIDTSAPTLKPVEIEGEPSTNGTVIAHAAKDKKPTSTSSSDVQEEHICVTSPAATIYERVGPYLFSFPASAFFQNNNSVLVPLTEYVKDAIESATVGQGSEHPTHLVDSYCGSGLFSIMLSSSFETISGIDISVHSVSSAITNLSLNSLPRSKFSFQTGTASDVFANVSHFPPSQTAVVIDPPRKGCDEPFLRQLLNLHPKVMVYVSCNVHTQARDVGWLLKTQAQEGKTSENGAYRIVSLRGFDLFPQTSHVESVAVLVRD